MFLFAWGFEADLVLVWVVPVGRWLFCDDIDDMVESIEDNTLGKFSFEYRLALTLFSLMPNALLELLRSSSLGALDEKMDRE